MDNIFKVGDEVEMRYISFRKYGEPLETLFYKGKVINVIYDQVHSPQYIIYYTIEEKDGTISNWSKRQVFPIKGKKYG